MGLHKILKIVAFALAVIGAIVALNNYRGR